MVVRIAHEERRRNRMQDEPGGRAVTEVPAASSRGAGGAPEPDGPRDDTGGSEAGPLLHTPPPRGGPGARVESQNGPGAAGAAGGGHRGLPPPVFSGGPNKGGAG